jgi:hypothetical protein
MTPVLGALCVLIAVLIPSMAIAEGACEDVAISGTPRLSIADTYSPFAAADLTALTTVTIQNAGDDACPLAAVFAAADNGQLRNAGETLSYTLETPDGAALLNGPGIADPEAGHHIDLTLSGGQAASLSVRARVPAQQMAPPGGYADNTAVIRLYRMPADGFPALLTERPFPVSTEVAAVCRLSPPQPATLDFTSDIGPDARPQGRPRSALMPEAACNTGARLKLSGRALARDGEVPAGFDDVIDFVARARLRSVAATLVTRGTEEVAAQSARAGTNGTAEPVKLDVQLRPGRPLAAGRYQTVLTIALEPSP